MREQEPVSSPLPKTETKTEPITALLAFTVHAQTSDKTCSHLAVNSDVVKKIMPLVWMEAHCNSVRQTRNQSAL